MPKGLHGRGARRSNDLRSSKRSKNPKVSEGLPTGPRKPPSPAIMSSRWYESRPGAATQINPRPQAVTWWDELITSTTAARESVSRVEEGPSKKSLGTLEDADLRGRKVLVRANLDVPLDESYNIISDHRLRASADTIKFLVQKRARVIVASHMGHPEGVDNPEYSLNHLVPRLSDLLGVAVIMADDCIGVEVTELVDDLPEGGVLLLENVRFYYEEEKNSDLLAGMLASHAHIYVNDDFGTAHEAHASTEGVTKFFKDKLMPAVAGFRMQEELDYFAEALAKPKRPLAAIVGGSKTNIGIIEPLLAKVDILILGGGMIYTFYKAQEYSVGKSTVQEDKLELATSLIEKANENGVHFLLPTDIVVAKKLAADAKKKTVAATAIPDNWVGVDIGPETIKTFKEELDKAQTIIWNGVMGVSPFEDGTEAIAMELAELREKGVTVITGAASVAAVEKAGMSNIMSYNSTGEDTIWALLGGKTVPAAVLGLYDA